MREFLAIFLCGILAVSAVAQETPAQATAPAAPQAPQAAPLPICIPGATTPCTVAPHDRKEAKKQFDRAIKLRNKNRLREAFDIFSSAAALDPQSADYLTAREVSRQQLVYEALNRANDDLSRGRRVEAMAELRGALELDPTNDFARQRVRDMLGVIPSTKPTSFELYAAADAVQAEPQAITKNFSFRGDSRALLETVAKAYGLSAAVDDSIQNRRVRMEVTNVDFPTAMMIAGKLTKSFWTVLSPKQVFFAADNDANRRAFEQMALRTFYIPEATTPQELNDLLNTLRVLFDIRYITHQPASGTLTLRAPRATLEAATQFLEGLSEGRPQVMFDVKVYEVSHSFTRDLGVQIPTQFTTFNIPSEALKLLGSRSVQDIINQLIASGSINQANSTAIAALIAQQLSQGSSVFAIPFAVFGGGITLQGLSIPSASLKLNMSDSSVRSLEHLNFRASQADPAIVKIGTRVPIINATYAPIFANAAISKVLQNQSYQAPFPSFSYEDVGIDMKATPLIHGDSDVAINLEMQVRAIGAASINGVPIISNREYKGTISVKNGESAVIAGMLTKTEQNALSGPPVLSQIPILGYGLSTRHKEAAETELLVVMTPHILRSRQPRGATEIPLQ